MAAVAGLVPCAESGMMNFLARIALRLVPRPRQQNAGEFAVRARRRLQGDGVHAGNLEQTLLQKLDDFHDPLRQRVRAVGMRVGQTLDARNVLVHPRVVFHGARAQRIHPEVDGIIPRREPREVADDLDLAQFGQQARRLAMRLAEQCGRVHCWHVERRQFVSLFARRRLLKDQPLVLRLMCPNLARRFSLNCRFRCHPLFATPPPIPPPLPPPPYQSALS